MPNNSVVEERVVEMRIDNAKFEAGAKKTIGILEELDKSLKGLGKENADGFDSIESSLDKVTDRFSAMGIVGDQVIRNLTNKAMELVNQLKNVATTLTTQQIDAGWDKYADKTQAIQTIMAATNKTIEEGRFADQAEQLSWVNEQIEKLNKFTDETSYNFLDMVGNIGKFTAAGRELEESVTAMQGIATWAAISGGRPAEASRAMYNLSQALGMGAVTVQDWKSIENANMATYEFKEQVIDIAEQLGKLKKVAEDTWEVVNPTSDRVDSVVTVENFRNALGQKWFDNDVLLAVLNRYGEFSDLLIQVTDELGITATEYLKAMKIFKDGGEEGLRRAGYAEKSILEMLPSLRELSQAEYELGYRAFQAAQEAKTFQEAIDATKDAVSTKWMDVFELMFGNYLEAKELWTNLAETLWDIFAGPIDRLKEIIKSAYGAIGDEGGSVGRSLAGGMESFEEKLASVGKTMKDFEEAYKEVIGAEESVRLLQQYESIEEALRNGAVSAENFKKALGALDDGYDTAKTIGLNRALNKAGKTMNDFNKALLQVADEGTIETIRSFGTIEEAVKSGAISVEDLKKALESLGIESGNVAVDVEDAASSAVGSLKEMRDVALGILRGDYDNGEERRKILEEMGLDYELMQAMAGDLKNLGEYMSDEELMAAMESYYQYNNLGERLGFNTFAEYLASATESVGRSVDAMEDFAENADSILSSIYGQDILDAGGEVKHAGELFREGLMNIMTFFDDLASAADKAFLKVFGGSEDAQEAIENLGDRFFGVVAKFWEFTNAIQLTQFDEDGQIITDRFDRLSSILAGLMAPIRLIGKLVGVVFRIAGTGLGIVMKVLSPIMRIVTSLFGLLGDGIDMLSNWIDNSSFFNTLESIGGLILNTIIEPLEKLATVVETVVSAFRRGFGEGGFKQGIQYASDAIEQLLQSHPVLEKMFNTLRKITEPLSVISENFARGVKRLVPNGERLIEIVGNVQEAILGLFQWKTDDNTVEDFATRTENTLLKLEDTAVAVGNVTRGITDGLFGDEQQKQEFRDRVTGFVTSIWEGILNGLRSIRISDVIGAMRLSLIASIAADILSAITVFKSIGERIRTIPEIFMDIGKHFSDALRGLAATFTANAVLKIAISIGLLAFAFAKMAKIPKDDLTHAASVTTVVVAILVLLAKELGKINVSTLKIFQEMPSLTGALFGFAAVIAALAGTIVALTLVQNFGPGKFLTAVGSIIAVITVIALLISSIIKITKRLNSQKIASASKLLLSVGGAMIMFSAAINMLVAPIVALSLLQNFGPGKFDKAILAVLGIILALGGIIAVIFMGVHYLSDKDLIAAGKLFTRIASAMLVVALAMQLLALPIIEFSLLQNAGPEKFQAAVEVVKGIITNLAVLVGMFGLLMIIAGSGRMNEIGKTMMQTAGAMVLIALAVRMMAKPIIQIAELSKEIEDIFILKSLAYLLSVIAGIGAILVLMNRLGRFTNPDGIMKLAAAITLISFAMLLMTPVLIGVALAMSIFAAALSGMDESVWEKFATGLERLTKLSKALLWFGAALLSIGVGSIAMGAGIVSAAVGIFMLAAAFALVIIVLPKFVDMLLDLREVTGEELWASLKKVALVVGLLTVGLIALTAVMSGLFRMFKPGFITSAGNGIVRAFRSIVNGIVSGTKSGFDKTIEFLRDPKNKRVILAALETVIVLAGAYIAGIIPSLTHVIFGGIVELIKSLADELQTQKDVLVEAVTGLVKGVLDVVTELFGSLFGEQFQSSLSSSERWLFRIIVAFGALKGVAAALNITNGFSKLKDLLIGGGKSGGLISNLGSVKTGIEKIITAAGGLGSTLSVLGVVAAASAYAADNLSKQQEILEANAFEGEGRSLEDYAKAIENVQARINELQEQSKSGWTAEGGAMAEQELEAQIVLLNRITKQYDELLKAQKETAEEGKTVSNELSDADEARSEKFAAKQAARTEAIAQETQAIEDEKTALEGFGSVFDNLKEQAGSFNFFGMLSDAFSEQGVDINDFIFSNGTFDSEKITSMLDTDRLRTSIKNKMESVGPSVGEGLAEGIPDGYSSVSTVMGDFRSNIVDFFCQELGINSPSKVFADLGIGIPEGVAEGVETGKYLPLGGLANMMTAMVNMFNGTSQRFYNSGVSIVQGLINGIGNNFQAAFITGRNLAVSIENGFNSRLKIRSPSKVFMELAGYITQGLAMGIENSSDTAIDSIVVLGDELMQAIERSMAMVSVMADEDFTISPRIAPVVDLSMARGASGALNDLFRSPGLYATVGRATNEQALRYSAYGPASTSNQATINELHALSEQVDELNEAITNMQIVLDSGVLVGATSAKMDQRLGQMAVRKGRGN